MLVETNETVGECCWFEIGRLISDTKISACSVVIVPDTGVSATRVEVIPDARTELTFGLR